MEFGKGQAMKLAATNHSEMTHDEEADDRVMFGFWVYLMTDLLMFSV